MLMRVGVVLRLALISPVDISNVATVCRGTPSTPEVYTELLEFEQPTRLIWDETPPDPPGQASEPRPDQLEILSALFELRFLLTSQIPCRWR